MRGGRVVVGFVAPAIVGVALTVGCGLTVTGQLESTSGGLSEAGSESGLPDGSSSSGGITDGGPGDGSDPDGGFVFLGDAGGRTTRGLVALYPMRETFGTIVHDTEGTVRLDLGRIVTAVEMRWDPLGLTFFGNGSEVSSPVAFPTKITAACKASSELSAEAWVTPAAAAQSGPARILSLSNGVATQSIMLGIGDDGNVDNQRARWVARVQHDERAIFESNDDVVTAALHHVVVTAKTGSPLRMFVDNLELTNARGNVTIGSDFDEWFDTNSFRLGGELGTLDRRFKGTISLVAIYCVELTAAEIDANFRAGARPL
ncbi:MAG: hypothetical protein JST00_42890 [Deltaproteobacteria bacterium]|nr:hypothetical protein [Deltaproteobacteria bacterium]